MHTAYICLGGLAGLQVLLLLQFSAQWLRRGGQDNPSSALIRTLAVNSCVGPLAVLDGLLMVAIEFKGTPAVLNLVYYATTVSLYLLALAMLNSTRWLQILATLLCLLGNVAMAAAMLMPMGGY